MFASKIDLHSAEVAEADVTLHIPRITAAAFCETPEVRDAVTSAAGDRRMIRTKLSLFDGSILSAVERYRQEASPDLIILERQVPDELLIEELERLANVCDVGTRVLVIGASNDVALYRDLLARGISDYLVAPLEALDLVAAISRIYASPGAKKLGRTHAFIGSKGGTGSSLVAHNVASALAGSRGAEVILADLDLGFGTASLDFNIDMAQGVVEALDSTGRLDELLLDRLLSKCGGHLGMLAAPTSLDRPFDLDETAFDELLEVARGSASHVVLDVPHLWTSWARRLIVGADEVVITATPDLASLRNTKSLIEILRQARPNDTPQRVVLNQVGMPKRPEIKPADFAKALQLELSAVIPFDARVFGGAVNKGQMIAEVSAKAAAPIARIAEILEGRGSAPAGGKSLLRRLVRAR